MTDLDMVHDDVPWCTITRFELEIIAILAPFTASNVSLYDRLSLSCHDISRR